MYTIIYTNNNNVGFVEKIFAWFFIEHIFEAYAKNAGKFFVTNKDFRQKLITNFIVLLRNILCWSYFVTLFEFINLIIILAILNYILYIALVFDKKKNNIIYFFYLTFYFLFILLLYFKLYEFTFGDIYYLIKPSFILFQLFIIVYFINIYIVFFFILMYTSNKVKKKKTYLYLQIFFFRIFLYFILIVFFILFIVDIFFFYNKIYNNFIHELIIKVIIIYTFSYYTQI